MATRGNPDAHSGGRGTLGLGLSEGLVVNLEQKHVWHARGCDTRDHVLDLWCERPREWRWKDEDELEQAVVHGVMPRSLADEIRTEGERVAGMIERWEPPFSDGWERWEPDPAGRSRNCRTTGTRDERRLARDLARPRVARDGVPPRRGA